MATATGTTFWSYCASAQCDGAKDGKGRRFITAKDTTGKGLCGPCGKKAGEAKRPLATTVFGATDTVNERTSLTASAQVAKVAEGSHKALHTEGGRVRGGVPEQVAKVVAAKLPKATAKKAPQVKAPRKAAAKKARPAKKAV